MQEIKGPALAVPSQRKLTMRIVRQIQDLVYDRQGEALLGMIHLAPQTADEIRTKAREYGVSAESVIIASLERLYGKEAV